VSEVDACCDSHNIATCDRLTVYDLRLCSCLCDVRLFDRFHMFPLQLKALQRKVVQHGPHERAVNRVAENSSLK